MSTKIPAFLDGNNYVHYSHTLNRLFVGNECGLVKIFNPEEPDSEPVCLDALESLASLTSFGDKVVITSVLGVMAIFQINDIVADSSAFTKIYQSSAPLRSAQIINDGNRILCGGDSTDLVIVDCSQNNKTETFAIADKLVGISYNSLGELVALALANGEVHVYSVSNEKPELVEKIEGILPRKANSSTGDIDYQVENAHELVCTRTLWTSNGETALIPTGAGSVKAVTRSSWATLFETSPSRDTLVAFAVAPSHKYVALLFDNRRINIHSMPSFDLVKSLDGSYSEVLPIDITWARKNIYVGGISGELHALEVSLDDDEAASEAASKHVSIPNSALSDVDKLFLEEASDSETEELSAPAETSKKRDNLDDSTIIDQDDDDEYRYHNRTVDEVLADRRKRARFSPSVAPISHPPTQHLVPYSPGSTPWIQSVNSGTSATKRRYLFMNAVGYAWSVKNASDDSDTQKSVTVSFFDRSVNKDYHFIDYYDYDLCSMNERGVLLGCSGYENSHSANKGRVFYRHHVNTSDSWDRHIPLAKDEYITAICITSSTTDTSGDSIVVVGTNHGYLRFFNLYGLCINIMKVSPVISLISSAINTVFCIHHSGHDHYSYSIISVPDDYKFYQQECNLPIKSSRAPLLKGLFFNDHSDPCLVAGHDDTLVVLSHWREASNARWVPLLNCTDAVSDFGASDSKKNWKCWPLGLQEDRAVCLILKNNDIYPGFPLPLPVELDLRLPTKCYRTLFNKDDDEDELAEDDELERKLQKVREDDPEEEFLRVSTLGRLLASSLADLGDEEEHLDTLKNYSLVFDKSLLKLFNSACQESRLNKAFSVAKLIKNDKALLAATKIAERHSFSNLMAKINRLREELMESLEEEEE